MVRLAVAVAATPAAWPRLTTQRRLTDPRSSSGDRVEEGGGTSGARRLVDSELIPVKVLRQRPDPVGEGPPRARRRWPPLGCRRETPTGATGLDSTATTTTTLASRREVDRADAEHGRRSAPIPGPAPRTPSRASSATSFSIPWKPVQRVAPRLRGHADERDGRRARSRAPPRPSRTRCGLDAPARCVERLLEVEVGTLGRRADEGLKLVPASSGHARKPRRCRGHRAAPPAVTVPSRARGART